MSARMLNEILKTLKENGFIGGVFANSDGLILASAKSDLINEKVIGAIVAMLQDAADKAKIEMGLDEMISLTIRYKNGAVFCRQINIEKTNFLLAGITNPPQTDEIAKYHEDLMDWAVQNALAPLKKLVQI
jgi:predicted regulator of Ras-like GTPase activity (Roadblock/LC7/MglB family)